MVSAMNLTDHSNPSLDEILKAMNLLDTGSAAKTSDAVEQVRRARQEALDQYSWRDVPRGLVLAWCKACLACIYKLLLIAPEKIKPHDLRSLFELVDRAIIVVGPEHLLLDLGFYAEQRYASILPRIQGTSRQRLETLQGPARIVEAPLQIKIVEHPLPSYLDNSYLEPCIFRRVPDIVDWPAFQKWQDLNYIRREVGHRHVPVEVGRTYLAPDHHTRYMSISEYLDRYVEVESSEIAYLAQYDLASQLSCLDADISEPSFCQLANIPNKSTTAESNIWLGMSGTITPLHYDKKYNLLTQVVGSKRVRLYSPQYTESLYPFESALRSNASQVDLNDPDPQRFPKFADIPFYEFELGSGDVLYIPPLFWHYVEATTFSISVNFWF